VINSVSTRPGYAGYVPPKAPATSAADTAAFADVTARSAATRRSAVSVENGAVQAGIELSRAYELASKRQSAPAAVPRDLLWALTGPGRAPDAAP
jgi:hypothetical protein